MSKGNSKQVVELPKSKVKTPKPSELRLSRKDQRNLGFLWLWHNWFSRSPEGV